MNASFFYLIVIFTLVTGLLYANMNGPRQKLDDSIVSPHFSIDTESTTTFVFGSFIKIYSSFISPVDGARSPSYPTGATYGFQAMQEHGFFWGMLLIADRLVHEGDPQGESHIVLYGIKRHYDPVGHNTFFQHF